VALHDLDLDAIKTGEKSKEELRAEIKGILGKARTQIQKDYVAWPAFSAAISTGVRAGVFALRKERRGLRDRLLRRPGRSFDARTAFKEAFLATLTADAAANVVRNLWSHAIIFCGHFPDQTYTFSQDETEDESRGAKYVRQLIGAANIEGGPLFHVISGNLGYQVEHHLFPDMPSTRYAEIAPRVREICERYGLPYNTGPFFQQWGMVNRTILRLALPGGEPRPKPGPYRGDAEAQATSNGRRPQRAPEDSEIAGPEQSSNGVRVSVPPRD
jgi:hypothetical protein